jgi:kinesin family member 18/19
VFTHTAKPLLDGVLDGFNATVFAYGATGCGKTHTIRCVLWFNVDVSGTPDAPGLIYLTTQELFERCDALTEKKVEISLSFLEIYNETIKDLLVPVDESKPLMLREDAQHRISVPGLTTAAPITVPLSHYL